MQLLVTGGAGFIGRHVLDAAQYAGHSLRVLDSLREDVHTERPDLPGTDVTVADVRDPSAVRGALAGVDVVIHLAAKVGLGVALSDLPDYASSNDLGTAQLLTSMADAGVNRLVLASSMVVYGEGHGTCPEHGETSGRPRREADLRSGRFEPTCEQCSRPLAPALVTEDARMDPRNSYAVSKVAQELYASSWARETGASVAALRFHNVYGPGMPANTPYAGVAAIFSSALNQGNAPHVFEDGGQRRDFVHVRDIARAVLTAAERHTSGARTFNVGSGTPRTVGDIAAVLADVMRGPTPVVTGQFRLGDVRHITADSRRIRAELGWTPTEDFTAGIAELAQQS